MKNWLAYVFGALILVACVRAYLDGERKQAAEARAENILRSAKSLCVEVSTEGVSSLFPGQGTGRSPDHPSKLREPYPSCQEVIEALGHPDSAQENMNSGDTERLEVGSAIHLVWKHPPDPGEEPGSGGTIVEAVVLQGQDDSQPERADGLYMLEMHEPGGRESVFRTTSKWEFDGVMLRRESLSGV